MHHNNCTITSTTTKYLSTWMCIEESYNKNDTANIIYSTKSYIELMLSRDLKQIFTIPAY